MFRVKFVKLRTDAIVPKKATDGSAGYDLYPINENGAPTIYLEPNARKLVKTGIQMALPSKLYAQVCSRSGLALKQGVCVLNAPGIIDSDYRGEIGVILHNSSNENIELPWDKPVAQLVFAERIDVNFDETTPEAMDKTIRGAGGFGSTS